MGVLGVGAIEMRTLESGEVSRAWDREYCQRHMNDETRKSQGLASPRVPPQWAKAGVGDLTWFPLVPGGPSFPG